MPIIETISVINVAARSIASIFPGLKGKTQHMSYAQAESQAKAYAERIAKACIDAYTDTAANGIIADYCYANTLQFIRVTSNRWSGNDKTNAAISYLASNPPTAGVIQRGAQGITGYLYSILYIHAWWILYNMNVNDPDEWERDIIHDTNGFTLVPAIKQAGYNPNKLDVPAGGPSNGGGTIGGSGSSGTTSGASILGGLNVQTLLLIGIAIFIIAGVFKR